MKDALIVLGMGGPAGVATIRPFLYNLFSDREIINFHIGDIPQKLIARIIASKRSKKIAPEYLKMGFNGVSPQNVYTKELVQKIPKLYQEKTGTNLDIFSGMCYFHPFIKEAAENIAKSEYNKLTVLPLFPHYSTTTTGACFSKLNKFINLIAPKVRQISTIPYWYENKKYNGCIIKRIKIAAETLGTNIENCFILFSAHSLPEKAVNNGDPYVSHIETHAKLLAEIGGFNKWKISYQSKVGPVKWVGPSTIDTLNELKTAGINNIIVVPIAFISDHIETLIELDEMLLPSIKRSGLQIIRAQSLNADDDFAESITSVILEKNL